MTTCYVKPTGKWKPLHKLIQYNSMCTIGIPVCVHRASKMYQYEIKDFQLIKTMKRLNIDERMRSLKDLI